jgi:hypothetical protein
MRSHTDEMRIAAIAFAGAVLSLGCSGTGTLSLHLTDAPPDLASLSAVLVTIGSIDVHMAGDDDRGDQPDGGADLGAGWRTLERAPEAFDLLKLQNNIVAALGEMELPAGKITQIRMHIDTAGQNQVDLANGLICTMDLHNVDQTGVKINHPFKVDIEAGQTTDVVVDFDVRESVSQDDVCVFRLNPVIKIKSAKIR